MKLSLLKKLAISLFLFPLVAGLACSGAGSEFADDTKAEVDDPAGKADGVVRPLGTYASQYVVDQGLENDEAFIRLSLKSDYTYRFEADLMYVEDPNLVIQGTYRFTKGGDTRYIKLTAEDGTQTRFAYELEGQKLLLRLEYEEYFETYVLAQSASCEEQIDCTLQGLTPSCEGSWTCNQTRCINRCENAGGSFERLAGLLSQPGIFQKPAVAKRYDLPDQAFEATVRVVPVEEGIKPLAEQELNDFYENYDIENLTELIDADVRVTMQYGMDNPEVYQHLTETAVTGPIAEELKTLLQNYVDYFRLSYYDVSAELIGEDYILIHPMELNGGETQAIQIELYYSEVY